MSSPPMLCCTSTWLPSPPPFGGHGDDNAVGDRHDGSAGAREEVDPVMHRRTSVAPAAAARPEDVRHPRGVHDGQTMAPVVDEGDAARRRRRRGWAAVPPRRPTTRRRRAQRRRRSRPRGSAAVERAGAVGGGVDGGAGLDVGRRHGERGHARGEHHAAGEGHGDDGKHRSRGQPLRGRRSGASGRGGGGGGRLASVAQRGGRGGAAVTGGGRRAAAAMLGEGHMVRYVTVQSGVGERLGNAMSPRLGKPSVMEPLHSVS